MKIYDDGYLIRIYSHYDPGVNARLKSIPGARFQKDSLGSYWTIPAANLSILLEIFNLSLGSLYPHCTRFINPSFFSRTKAEIKHDHIKISGLKAQHLAQSIYELCSYETQDKNEIITQSLTKEIYNKAGIFIFQYPPGLYWRILDFLNHFKISLTIHPYPKSPELNPISIDIKGRYYQQETVDKILKKQIPSRATLVMATGAGKTIMSAMITAALGLNTIFYTYSTELLEQTAAVYEEVFKQKIGRIGGNFFDIQPITVATVQTVYSCLEKQDERWQALSAYLETVDLTFVDEGHMLGADTIFTVAQAANSYYSYALTATPYREDGKEILIEAGTGPVREIISEKELEENGFILPVEIELFPVEHPVYRSRAYSVQYKKHIVNNNTRNNLIASLIKKQDKQTIVLVEEIKHGNKLSELTGAPFIHGRSKMRKEILHQFKTRQIPAIIASSILKQGVDIPEAEVLILAHGGVSAVEIMQKIGRVRRPAPGKEKGIVIDFYDYCNQPINDIFRRQSERRMALYESKNFTVIGHCSDENPLMTKPII